MKFGPGTQNNKRDMVPIKIHVGLATTKYNVKRVVRFLLNMNYSEALIHLRQPTNTSIPYSEAFSFTETETRT